MTDQTTQTTHEGRSFERQVDRTRVTHSNLCLLAQTLEFSDDVRCHIQAGADEIERLQAIEAAARNLVKVKGRYHTEQAFKALAALLVNTEGKRPAQGTDAGPV